MQDLGVAQCRLLLQDGAEAVDVLFHRLLGEQFLEHLGRVDLGRRPAQQSVLLVGDAEVRVRVPEVDELRDRDEISVVARLADLDVLTLDTELRVVLVPDENGALTPGQSEEVPVADREVQPVLALLLQVGHAGRDEDHLLLTLDRPDHLSVARLGRTQDLADVEAHQCGRGDHREDDDDEQDLGPDRRLPGGLRCGHSRGCGGSGHAVNLPRWMRRCISTSNLEAVQACPFTRPPRQSDPPRRGRGASPT